MYSAGSSMEQIGVRIAVVWVYLCFCVRGVVKSMGSLGHIRCMLILLGYFQYKISQSVRYPQHNIRHYCLNERCLNI